MDIRILELRHLLKAVFWSLLIFAIGFSGFISLNEKEFNLMGFVISVYYLIPVILFALGYVTLVRWLIGQRKLKYLSSSLAGQVVLSLVLGLLYITLWIVYDGALRDYRDMHFSSYWIGELKRYSLPLGYFGITIPVILKILVGTRNPNR